MPSGNSLWTFALMDYCLNYFVERRFVLKREDKYLRLKGLNLEILKMKTHITTWPEI